MDLLTLLIWVAFYALFAVSIRRFLRFRTSLDRSVMLVFASTAALFAISAVNAFMPAFAPVLSPVAITLLLAQPSLMLLLVGLFVRLPRAVVPAAVVGCVAVLAAFFLTDRSVPSVLLVVGYFALTEVLAALALVTEARRRHGFPRVRLGLAGAASLLFGLSILVAGAASAARDGGPTDPAILLATRSLALFAGLGYLAAFAPPRWLIDVAHRTLAFDLVRSLVSAPTGSDPAIRWRALATAAGNILGTDHVRIRRGEQLLADGHSSPKAACAQGSAGHDDQDGPRRDSISVPLIAEGGPAATLTARLDGRALFLEDDLGLIELLGSLTARAVDRERAVVDLAEARRAVAEAEAVRASEARFRALLEAEPNAVLAADHGGRIRWSTRSASAMFGFAESALAGRRLHELVEERGDRPVRGPGGSAAPRYETVGTRADGTTFPAEIARSQFELDGEPYELAVVTDISWRHEADAIRERFIGVLSHELRTPITAIFGGTQLLLNRGTQLDQATKAELLTDIAGESDRLQRMIENLLVLARVEGGGEVVEAGPVLLHRVLPDVIAREQAMWPSMSVTTDIPASLPPVTGDEASLSLVVRNLLSNAGKYAGADACVRVVVAREATDEVAVRVLDDGPGIASDEAGRLFDLYFRSKDSHKVPGSGIGLFVSRQLVEATGGRAWARSRPEGGAEFGFTLPIYSETEDTGDGLVAGDPGRRGPRGVPAAAAAAAPQG